MTKRRIVKDDACRKITPANFEQSVISYVQRLCFHQNGVNGVVCTFLMIFSGKVCNFTRKEAANRSVFFCMFFYDAKKIISLALFTLTTESSLFVGFMMIFLMPIDHD